MIALAQEFGRISMNLLIPNHSMKYIYWKIEFETNTLERDFKYSMVSLNVFFRVFTSENKRLK